ncbi:hypothetical protein MERGE_002006 [Pneumocystis wakefieldiae]|uniref:Uncharacterized protein n=1 Tax=Pneumocystis wakefieldiae TaxID=38082 RepID=A0A899FWN4_9ASCO|nr:hypothetical protein MERGE_002006 [Pneumocystis wakefieldiae]
MGLLISHLWNSLLGSKAISSALFIIGLDNAGRRLSHRVGKVDDIIPVAFRSSDSNSAYNWQQCRGIAIIDERVIEISNHVTLGNKNIKFVIWDLGGQTSLRQFWSTYYKSTSAVILVIDSTDKEKIVISKDELLKIMDDDNLKDSLLLVFANKQDIEDSMSPREISDFLGLVNFKDRPWHIQGCCGLTGDGLYKGLDWIVSSLNK